MKCRDYKPGLKVISSGPVGLPGGNPTQRCITVGPICWENGLPYCHVTHEGRIYKRCINRLQIIQEPIEFTYEH